MNSDQGVGSLVFTSNHWHNVPAKDGGSRPERGCKHITGSLRIPGRTLAQVISHYFTVLTLVYLCFKTASLGEVTGMRWQEEVSKENENGRKGNI